MTTRRNIIAGALIFASLAMSPAHARGTGQTGRNPHRHAEGRSSFRLCGSAARSRTPSSRSASRSSGSISSSVRRCSRPSMSAPSTSASSAIHRRSLPRRVARGYVRGRRQIGRQQPGDHRSRDSPIKTIADLKGKRIAFAKGSSANNLLVAALEKAGLSYRRYVRRRRSRRPMRRQPSSRARSMRGRSGIPIWRWPS